MDLAGYKLDKINIYRSYLDSAKGVFGIFGDAEKEHLKYCEFLAALVEYALDGVLPDWAKNDAVFMFGFNQVKYHIDKTRSHVWGGMNKDKGDIDEATPSATPSDTPSATPSATPSTNKNIECRSQNDNVEVISQKDKKENLTEKENHKNINGVCSPKGEVTSPNGELEIFHYDKPYKKFTFGEITFKNRDVEQIAISMSPVAEQIEGFPFWKDIWPNIASTFEMYKHKRLAIRMKHLLSEAGISLADYVAYLENVAANHKLNWSQITSVHYINGSFERIKGNTKVRN